jgi:hypothetical protein
MRVEIINCDFCKREFPPADKRYWDNEPCSIELKLSGPAQAHESRSFKDVCLPCRKRIVELWDGLIKKEESK